MKNLIHTYSLKAIKRNLFLFVIGILSIILAAGCIEEPEHTNPIDPDTSENVRDTSWGITITTEVNKITINWNYSHSSERDTVIDVYIHRILSNQTPDEDNLIDDVNISSGVYIDKDIPGPDNDKIKYVITLKDSGVYKILVQSSKVEMKIDKDEDGYLFRDDCNDDEKEERPDNPEKCDGLDNDCDGNTDNELIAPGNCTQKGVCIDTLETCNGTLGWQCLYPDTYEAESESICDGFDNDCDGETDENLNSPGNCKNQGICMGIQDTCSGELGWVCLYSEKYEEEESLCDGKDNDCDGSTDEELTPPGECDPDGICVGTVENCEGASGWICNYSDDYELDEQTCDYKDNDCDGFTDEGCDCVDNNTKPCGIDTGECEKGIQTCLNGRWKECSGNTDPTEEVCDGKDNDCDGDIDEALNGTTTCGIGECEHTIDNCVSGEEQTCNPMEGKLDEICDGLDNDCDGITDEGHDKDAD